MPASSAQRAPEHSASSPSFAAARQSATAARDQRKQPHTASAPTKLADSIAHNNCQSGEQASASCDSRAPVLFHSFFFLINCLLYHHPWRTCSFFNWHGQIRIRLFAPCQIAYNALIAGASLAKREVFCYGSHDMNSKRAFRTRPRWPASPTSHRHGFAAFTSATRPACPRPDAGVARPASTPAYNAIIGGHGWKACSSPSSTAAHYRARHRSRSPTMPAEGSDHGPRDAASLGAPRRTCSRPHRLRLTGGCRSRRDLRRRCLPRRRAINAAFAPRGRRSFLPRRAAPPVQQRLTSSPHRIFSLSPKRVCDVTSLLVQSAVDSL